MAEVASPRKVVLVTDPGRDIDDVVTLITLAGANFTFPGEPADPSKYELVGIVTSGGAALKRACVARGWMRLLGVSDELPIAASEEVDGIGKLACFFPAGFPTPASAALCTASEEGITPATELIVSLAERHGSDLALWCIAPLTPLALAISDYGGADGRGAAALRSIGALFVQGQALIAGDAEESGAAPGTLVPSAECFNLREDMASAHAVFQAVQDVVPIRMLGKFAAYRVSIFRADFNAFDAPLRDAGYLDDSGRSSDAFEAGEGEGGAAGGEGAAVATAIPALLQAAKNNLNIFRTGNPTLFYSIYPVPLAEQNDEEWFNSIDICCHPYDPLLCLSAMMPELFAAQSVAMGAPATEFGEQQPLASAAARSHTFVGNDKEHDGVPSDEDVAAVHDALCERLHRASARMLATVEAAAAAGGAAGAAPAAP